MNQTKINQTEPNQTEPNQTEEQRARAEKFAAYSILQEKEVDTNYDIFMEKHFSRLYEEHPEEYALMKNGELLEIYDTRGKAMIDGDKRFADRIFSTHKITKEVACLGFFTPSS